VAAVLWVTLSAVWGLVVMAATVRAFDWLRARGGAKTNGGRGFVRLLLGVSSFLLITQGVRLVAAFSHLSQTNGILVALIAAGAFLAYRGLRDTRRNIASTTSPPVRGLGRALGVQVALLPVYGFWALVGSAVSPSSPAWVAVALLGAMWLFVSVLLVIWWREGRPGLTRRAVAWAAVAWLSVFIPFFMPWERSRRMLVPTTGRAEGPA
jgi:hypothetical protein